MRVPVLIAMAVLPAMAAPMPPSQQNELVAKYCGVCHSDAHPNGGISLEHFDAARPDAGMTAMMLSKFRGNAFGASGQPLPDKATQLALMGALSVEAAGAGQWIIGRTEKPRVVSVSIVSEVPRKNTEPNLYRLTV
ncbi:MAG: hypothetical protein KGN84_08820 [Acidobacteriota bacterium]|nr:hypothetical protein [Acidobacteriota bacterium]